MYTKYFEKLNDMDCAVRLDALRNLVELVKNGTIPKPECFGDVNNHIHTTYSFSPYSPTKALWMAYTSGLQTAGIMDHDSVSGIEEFKKAGEILGMATTAGVEVRAKMHNTPLCGKLINNPDQKSIAYMAIHGIPASQVKTVEEFLAPYRAKRNHRNIKMVANINGIFEKYGITLDFEKDVAPLSNNDCGGSVTERHILYALSKKITEKFGKGQKVVDFLTNDVKIDLSAKVLALLADENNEHYEYDLLGALKSNLVSKFYIDADEECPDVTEVIALAKKVGGISAYAYLGDVENSVTGDKKAQKFEDDYLDLLFDSIMNLGFDAVTYMPSRNTSAQLTRIKDYAKKCGLLEISGEDINSPRQKFVCEALRQPMFANLIDATWALIGHEVLSGEDLNGAMFSEKTKGTYPNIADRIEYYKNAALKKYVEGEN